MRLINADALSDWMKDYGQKCIKGEMKISLMYIWKHIQDTPTIDPQRKKGKWVNIREGNRADCDQCGQSGRAWMNFCFDCGADMREPEDIPMEYFESGGR